MIYGNLNENFKMSSNPMSMGEREVEMGKIEKGYLLCIFEVSMYKYVRISHIKSSEMWVK